MTATMRSYCDLHWRHGGVSAGRRSDGGCDGCFESGLPLLRVLAEWYIPDGSTSVAVVCYTICSPQKFPQYMNKA